MNVMEWASPMIADLDPAINTAIGSITAAISMAIITIVSYYFPKDHNKFDEYDLPKPRRKRKKNKRQMALEESGGQDD